MKISKFEEYLKEQHAKMYMGTDDDMPDSFERWLTEMAVDDLIAFADKLIEKYESN